MADPNKKRDFPHYLQDHQQPPKRTTSHSFLSAGFGAVVFSPESLSYIETEFLRPLVREEAERQVEAYFNLPQSYSSSSQVQVHDETGDQDQVVAAGSGTVKLKLCFLNNIPSTIFTTNQIQADNDEPLQVALCDITNNFNNIIVETTTHPLSSALIEFVVLDGEFASAQRDEGIHWTVAEFNKSIVTRRAGERPSLVGNDKTIRLKNGVAFINNLTFTQNSSRSRTKMIRLGVRIIDDEILANYPRIGEAVSNPFRVKDYRGQANKKRHPPKGEDEVYRLEGIGKDGERHKHLSSKGIKTVDDFVKAYEKDPRYLRKLLGKRVSDKKWKAMVKHALEYVPLIPTFDPISFEPILVENNEVMEVNDQKIINPATNGHGFAETFFDNEFQDYSLIFQDYQGENTYTGNQYFQGAEAKNPTDANGWS